MKVAVLPVLLILAGAFASPPQNVESRNDVVVEAIEDILERIAKRIVDSGLDPVKLERYVLEYNGNLLQLKASVEDLSFTGASNYVVGYLSNNVLFGTFDFDVVLPEMSLTIGNSALDVTVGEYSVEGELKGSLRIRNIRLSGQVRYSGSIIIGVEIVGITLQNSIGGIEADVSLVANGNDYSERVNRFFNDILPNTLDNFSDEINALLAELIMAIIRRLTH